MKQRHLSPTGARRPPTIWFGLLAASALFLFPLLLAPWAGSAAGAGGAGGWHPAGLRGESVLSLVTASDDGRTLVYAETASGLWRKVEGPGAQGADWQRIDTGLPRSALGAPLLGAWRVVPGRPLEIYALAGPDDARQLFMSKDGGAAWALVNVAPGDSPSPALAVLPAVNGNADAIVIATPSRLWRSLDGGATWQAAGAWPQHAGDRPGNGENDVVRKLLVDETVPGRIVAVSQTGGLWLSENAGLSWHVGGLEEFEVTAAALSGTALWAASTGPSATGLIYSADGAVTWEARTLPAQAASLFANGSGVVTIETEPAIADSLYAATRGGKIYRTVDGGKTWELLGTPGATHVAALAVEPNGRSTLYAATDDGIWARPVAPVVPTITPSPTATPEATTELPPTAAPPAPTFSPTATSTETLTPTPSATATWTATATATATATRSSTATRRPATATARPKPPTLTSAPPTPAPNLPPQVQPTPQPAPGNTPTTGPVTAQPTATTGPYR